MRSSLYTGTLVHVRREPREHVFRHGVCFYVLDLDELPELERRLALFSANRPNVVTFHERDHPLGGTDRPLRERVTGFAAEHGVDVEGGRILLLTNLRVLGYVFNPVSFYWCYDDAGRLGGVVAEVWNTFGEMWPYFLEAGAQAQAGTVHGEQEKRLHVSPFFALEQQYRFVLSQPGERVFARVDVYEHGERRFGSVLAGERRELTNASLAQALVRYPLMPQRVIGAIHWQALRLYLKGVPFHRKPPYVPGKGSVRT